MLLAPFVLLATGAGFLWAVNLVGNKTLLEGSHSSTDITVVGGIGGIVLALLIPVVWVVSPAIATYPIPSATVVVVSLVAGLIYIPSTHLYNLALDREEASRVAPLIETAPLFTFVVGILVLGEVLSTRNLVGILLVVIGAMLVSPGDSCARGTCTGNLRFRLGRAFWLVVLGSSLYAVFAVLTRVAIQQGGDLWWVYFWSRIGGVVPVAVLTRDNDVLERTLDGGMRSRETYLLGGNELIGKLGLVLITAAFGLGPAALVDAVSATSPMFVMFMVLGLDAVGILDEDVSPRVLVAKTAAAGLIVGGVFLISV